MNWGFVKMQLDSPFMCPPALWITKFGQRAQPTFYEVCAIHFLSRWKNRNFVLPRAIEANHEDSFLMEM
jgi:hypothetical protein